MSKVVLRVDNISKQYRIGQLGTGTISHDLNRLIAKIRGKEDPYLKIGEANDRSKAGGSDYVWSLKDINFEVKQGDVLGIIGKNGAGKSTLLKILSQVTTPTTGEVKVKGRIAALLEVGTGFHPDLSGRENIFLNGAILGMTKQEIKSKLDEIVDFSGVAKYLDTPVKRYSSGMLVRLGFAVAAHLEPEILIVDEVLAVGDAEFQKKCLGKMKAVSGEGRTVLFVSHNMTSIKALCTSGLFLENGMVKYLGNIDQAITKYFNLNAISLKQKGLIPDNYPRINTGQAKIIEFFLVDNDDLMCEEIFYMDPLKIRMQLDVLKELKNVIFDIKIVSKEGIIISYSINSWDFKEVYDLKKGVAFFEVIIDNIFLPGYYDINVGVHFSEGITIDYLEHIYSFEILKLGKAGAEDYNLNWQFGYVNLKSKWKQLKNNI